RRGEALGGAVVHNLHRGRSRGRLDSAADGEAVGGGTGVAGGERQGAAVAARRRGVESYLEGCAGARSQARAAKALGYGEVRGDVDRRAEGKRLRAGVLDGERPGHRGAHGGGAK